MKNYLIIAFMLFLTSCLGSFAQKKDSEAEAVDFIKKLKEVRSKKTQQESEYIVVPLP